MPFLNISISWNHRSEAIVVVIDAGTLLAHYVEYNLVVMHLIATAGFCFMQCASEFFLFA